MAAPRQSKTESTSPDSIAVTGGSLAHSDRYYDLSVKVAGIERSITYLEAQAEKANAKLDAISDDFTVAKATFNTLKYLFIAICTATWGMMLALFLMWAKHHFNW